MPERTYTLEQIESLRDIRFRRTPKLHVRTEKQALDFVNNVGFCFTFKANNSELPCLWHAVCGKRNPVMPHHSHHDPYLGLVWDLKDTLPEKKAVYYGKALKKRPSMISLEYFPYFYALSGNSGRPDNYKAQYKKGELSSSARQIMDSLVQNSPQITRDLKFSSGHMRPSDRTAFDYAMAELQMKMQVVKIAELYDPFTFVWELVVRRFSAEIKRAAKITPETACEKILIKYFENVITSTPARIDRLFGWGKEVIEKQLNILVEKGFILPDIEIKGEKGKWYMRTES